MLCDLFNLLLLHHIAYPHTHRSHNSHLVLATVSQLWYFRAESPNYSWRAKSCAQRHFVNEKIIYLQTTCWFDRMQHISKQSHFVRCLALDIVQKLMWPPDEKVCRSWLGYWKSEHCFPYLKAAAHELGMTATWVLLEWVIGHTDELHSKKRANLAVQIFAILMLMRMNLHFGMKWTWLKSL